MILIFYSRIKSSFKKKERNMINQYFDIDMVNRVKKSSSSLHKKRRATFMCMMFSICQDLNIPFSTLKNIYHNDYGKLIMPNYNIQVSYSGEYVFCMLSSFKAGFDVEMINAGISEKEYKIFNHFFQTDIKEYNAFFKEWTRLESIVKYFDNKGIKDLMYNKIDTLKNKIRTIHMVINENHMVAISAPNLLTIEENIKLKHI